MGICTVVAALGFCGGAMAQLSRVAYTPHLLQEGFGPHGEFLPNDGSEYCVPTSFTMAMYWLRANGLTQAVPKLTKQNALDTDLAIAGFYGTTPDGGTQSPSTGTVAAPPKILTYLALRGIAGVEVRKFNKPDYAKIQEAVQGSNIGVINIAWVNVTTKQRTNGHDVTVVATGIDASGGPAPTNVVINNPMAPETQYVPTETLVDFGAFTGYLAFLPGYLSKTGVVPVIEGVTIITPSSFSQPLAPYRPTTNLLLSATGGSMSVLAPIAGAKGITKSGASTVVFEASSRTTYRGRTRITGGGVVTRAASGPALGRGDIQLLAGSLSVAPHGSGTAAPVLGVRGRRFSFTGGTLGLSQLSLRSLVVNVDADLLRGENGTLVIAPSHGLDALGRTESLVLRGGVPESLVDDAGGVSPAILGLDRNGAGDFLRYDAARGFVRAGVAGIEADEEIFDGQTRTGTTLRLDGATVHGAGTLRLEGAISGLILNGGAVSTSRLVLDARENVVFAGKAGGRIDARIEGAGGLVVTGPGTLRLGAGNDYSGPTIVNGGTVAVANADGSATGRGDVTVRAGATITGTGQIGGSVRVEGTLHAGTQVGKMRVEGNARFAANGVFAWELGELKDEADGAGERWSVLETGGDLAFDGSGEAFEILELHFPPGKGPNGKLAFWRQPHRWVIARAGGKLDVTGLAIQDPRFTAGIFSIVASGKALVLAYKPSVL
jgi:autotransporter-associated beta strand protein